jgi:putative component of membrane protein insertase Oxa1/YidC/SpoIIIJ protein YidD
MDLQQQQVATGSRWLPRTSHCRHRPSASSVAAVQLQGIGVSANILQADIVACGPSLVHVIDQASCQSWADARKNCRLPAVGWF